MEDFREQILENGETTSDNLERRLLAGTLLLAGVYSAICLTNIADILSDKPIVERPQYSLEENTIASTMSPNYAETLPEKTYEDVIALARQVWDQQTSIINPTEEQIATLNSNNVKYSLTTLDDGSTKLTVPFDESKPITAQYEKFIEKNTVANTTYYELCYRLPNEYTMYKVDDTQLFPGMVGVKDEPENDSYVLFATLSEYDNEENADIDINSVDFFKSGIPVYRPYKYLLNLKGEIINASKTNTSLNALDDNPYLFAVPKGYILYSLDGKQIDARQVDENENYDIYMFMGDTDINNIISVKQEDYNTLKTIDKLEEVIRDEYYGKTNSVTR